MPGRLPCNQAKYFRCQPLTTIHFSLIPRRPPGESGSRGTHGRPLFEAGRGVSAQALRELKDTPKLELIKANNTKVTRGDVDALAAEIKSFVVTIASSGGG